MEKVIFRTEFDPYINQRKFIAAFPEEEANAGRINYVAFFFSGDGKIITYEPYAEMDLEYYFTKTKIVHKNSIMIDKLVRAIEEKFGGKYKVVEKIPTKKGGK